MDSCPRLVLEAANGGCQAMWLLARRRGQPWKTRADPKDRPLFYAASRIEDRGTIFEWYGLKPRKTTRG